MCWAYKFVRIILILCIAGYSTSFSQVIKKENRITQKFEKSAIVKEGGKKGEKYLLEINNISLPIDNKGVLADVEVLRDDGSSIEGASFDEIQFLYSAGFIMAGKYGNNIFANAVASASRIEDYYSGGWQYGRNDARAQLYVLKSSDGDFHKSWNDWKDAVALGAKFYDGNSDGIYNPVDFNKNGIWDKNEDRPDLIGDETVWCVLHDGLPSELRRFSNVPPLGIEIRQTVFGFDSQSELGNCFFVRYEIVNTGMLHEKLDSVYFSFWADVDLVHNFTNTVTYKIMAKCISSVNKLTKV